ncbi:Omega-amidase NIT2 [Hondaea fermentalgiana]|uniref:Omega-amidase NIT2 n=1 Tax=Hondaea fermentalgiana TaxID=2315210 RepID=A0A2R5GC91_9STRA|nr:Omega-amidase NIT2 [Hondaea fermentalgiana]|eukprot:GBG26193.1 Omega-amidase NIT2 [Hondaea fermentalgiana]
MSVAADAGKKLLKLAMCQVMVGTDKVANLASARKAVQEAASKGAQLISLPECFNSPYATDQFPVYAEEIPASASELDAEKHPSTAMLVEAAKESKVFLVGGSFPEKDAEGKVYNTCLVISPEGEVLAKHRKVHLFDIDVPGGVTFKESDTLSAGDQVTVFDTPYCKVGVGICYDIRFAEYAMLLRQQGCKLIVWPGAFNTTTGPAHWELLQRARAVDNQLFCATASPARNPDSKYQAWGHSSIISPWGEVLATTEHDADIVYAEIDLGRADEVRTNIPISKQVRTDVYSQVKPAAN